MAYLRGKPSTTTKAKKAETIGLPHSSFLQAATYESTSQSLTLDFKNGLQEIYTNFSPAAWSQFSESTSHGSFYARQIKGKYASVSFKTQLKVSDFTKAKKEYNMRPSKRRVKGR